MNSFGRIFRLSIFGESHGHNVGIVIDGCPSGIPVTPEDLQEELKRRKAGAQGTTPRKEPDIPHLASGIFDGKTTGAPITILFQNTNTRSGDYRFRDVPRPGHADFVAMHKYGPANDFRGGGHFSGRITLGLVAAGVLAKKIIAPMTVEARLLEAGGLTDIPKAVKKAVAENDSIGGRIECRIKKVPIGLGEPFFDKIEAVLAHAIFSIPAIKGLEFGAGFNVAGKRGSQNNDCFISTDGQTETNNAAGMNGGISNGNEIYFQAAVKPPSSIALPQRTMNIKTGKMTTLEIEGRHDACIALRMPVIIEAAAAVTMADFMLLEQRTGRRYQPDMK